MKTLLLMLAIIALASCKTERIYLIVFTQETKTVTNKKTAFDIPYNRFTKQFNSADSIFNLIEKASNEAAKTALEKTKHLKP